jgi:hypothetical protein
MRRAVALLLTTSLSLLGCFPHNAHKRTLAQLGEGGAVVGGIAMEAMLNTGADCDAMTMPGAPPDSNCHTNNTILGNIGVALILGGLLGFVATISTAEEEKAPPPVDIKAEQPVVKQDLKLPPGVKPAATNNPAQTAATTATDPGTTDATPQPAPAATAP